MVISINYNEGKHRSWKAFKYKGVELCFIPDVGVKLFNTGDFIRDWFEMKNYIVTNELFGPLSASSTVDNFIMDGAPFSSAYLHMINDEPVLLYWDETKHTMIKDSYIFMEGWEFFVKKGTQPTWEELKKEVRDKVG